MNEIEEARAQIEEIDKSMIELFEKRMKCASHVANYKMSHGLPILDKNREKALIDRNVKLIENKDFEVYYREFFENMLDVSKKYQHRLMSGHKVAYSGIEGSFAAISVSRIFPDAERVSYKNFQDAYNAVVNCDCDVCVLPIENSFAGEVGPVTDLLMDGDLYINGVYELQVAQCLLGVKGSRVDEITTVKSHPQALEQCGEYIYEHNFQVVQATNTARAAKEVADNKDIHVAAIASRETAELYGLEVLDHDINKSSNNTTRFAVLSKNCVERANNDSYNTFILMFTVRNEVSALSKVIAMIGSYGFNMRVIRSRPLKDKNWQYYFYTEVEGKIESKEGDEMLAELSSVCETVKVVGSFIPETKI